jgi:hypothetical protein
MIKTCLNFFFKFNAFLSKSVFLRYLISKFVIINPNSKKTIVKDNPNAKLIISDEIKKADGKN